MDGACFHFFLLTSVHFWSFSKLILVFQKRTFGDNCHRLYYRLDALPVAKLTMSDMKGVADFFQAEFPSRYQTSGVKALKE